MQEDIYKKILAKYPYISYNTFESEEKRVVIMFLF